MRRWMDEAIAMPSTPKTRSAPSSKTSIIVADYIRHWRINRPPSSKQTCNSLRSPPSDPRLLPMQPVPSFVSQRRGAVQNYLDRVTATTSETDHVFNFEAVKNRSGHSTVMILVDPAETRFAAYWKLLEKMGCSYESMKIKLSVGRRLLFSVDVSPPANFDEVLELLERGKSSNILLFQGGHKFESH